MFGKILFATTASPTCDDAAKVAFELAEKYDSELLVLHVLGIPSRGFSRFIVDVRTGQEESYSEDYLSWVQEEMKTTYAKQLKTCPNARLIAQVGVPPSEILRLARQEGADLIIMGAHTRHEDIGATRYRGKSSDPHPVRNSDRR